MRATASQRFSPATPKNSLRPRALPLGRRAREAVDGALKHSTPLYYLSKTGPSAHVVALGHGVPRGQAAFQHASMSRSVRTRPLSLPWLLQMSAAATTLRFRFDFEEETPG